MSGEVMDKSHWNVVATMTAVCTTVYIGVVLFSLITGKADFGQAEQALLPLLAAWGGYFVALLRPQ